MTINLSPELIDLFTTAVWLFGTAYWWRSAFQEKHTWVFRVNDKTK